MKEQDFADDKECLDIRNSLIAKGIIVPGTSTVVKKIGNSPTVSTKSYSKVRRQDLINRGFISPLELKNGTVSYCELVSYRGKYIPKEDGEYRVRKIKTDRDYDRKRQLYFRIMQEILYSRKKLKLILGKKEGDDPDWYF